MPTVGPPAAPCPSDPADRPRSPVLSVLLARAVIARGGADGNTPAVFGPGRTSWDAVFPGILFAVGLFIGFETVAALGEEARRPRRRSRSR
jgi:amino acid transporter